MHTITIQQTLLQCGEGRLVLASDAERRPLLGLSLQRDGVAERFVQIDRVTMLELERGTIDLHTAMSERCAGIALSA
jgi:hypothetical protein